MQVVDTLLVFYRSNLQKPGFIHTQPTGITGPKTYLTRTYNQTKNADKPSV